MDKVTAAGIAGWDTPPSETGATLVQTRAARGAGAAAPGTLGVSLGAAGDLIRRLKAVAQTVDAVPEPEPDPEPEPAPEGRPQLTIVGEGVRRRGRPADD